jgi:tRNA 2-selenouridine synthase
LRLSPLFVIDLPLEVRVKKLVEDYGENMAEGLVESITNIKRRLGNERWKEAIDAVADKNFAKAAEIILFYYDKAYDKGIAMKETKEIFRFPFESGNAKEMAEVLIKAADEKYGN